MRTELVADALKNATATTLIEPDAIWHSDYAEKIVKPGMGSLGLWFGGRRPVPRHKVSCYFSV